MSIGFVGECGFGKSKIDCGVKWVGCGTVGIWIVGICGACPKVSWTVSPMIKVRFRSFDVLIIPLVFSVERWQKGSFVFLCGWCGVGKKTNVPFVRWLQPCA